MKKLLSWILAGTLALTIAGGGFAAYHAVNNLNSNIAKDVITPDSPQVAKDVITPDQPTMLLAKDVITPDSTTTTAS